VIVRHPVALAWLAALHVEAQEHALRRALATARSDLAEALGPPALTAFLEALEAERARLIAARRAVGHVADALAGRRWVPRL
jgi:vacuolar-type H+-ATPase subunit C/Vma6